MCHHMVLLDLGLLLSFHSKRGRDLILKGQPSIGQYTVCQNCIKISVLWGKYCVQVLAAPLPCYCTWESSSRWPKCLENEAADGKKSLSFSLCKTIKKIYKSVHTGEISQ